MDNFRKPIRTAKRSHSVDGFSSPKSQHAPVRQQFASNYQPQNATSLDSFRRSDGFSSAAMSPPVDTKAPLDNEGFKSKRKHRGRNKAKRTKFKSVVRVLFILLMVSALFIGAIAGYGYLKARQVFQGGGNAAALQKDVDPVKLKGEGDGRINIVMLGIGGKGHDGAYLTDTILIASIDPVQNELSLLSIPRDLWVHPNGGSASKINAVFALAHDGALAKGSNENDAVKAGATASEQILTSVLGIPIHYYVVVDFSGFEQAVNTVGGLDINVTADTAVTETMYDESAHKTFLLNEQPGFRHMDGLTALFYSRSRHTSARGDFARSDRQRQLLEAFKEKVESSGTYANPVKVTQLLSSFGEHVRTDLAISEMSRLYDIGKAITPDKTASISLADVADPLVTTGSQDGLSIVLPRAGLFNYTDIQSFVRNSLRDSFLKSENASIAILNGTSITGLAGKESTYLKGYGYNVASVGDAPSKTYAKSVLVDMRGGAKKYTLNYLQKRLGVTAVTTLPDPAIQAGTADFVLILGTDAKTTDTTTP